ncbi:SGNH/GDSL hydrolase family protein [Streptomyces sp. NPDC096033]|uniref:SGNH/GDSL hydrolase family protein n=1 Tax=Streptomyces sp. NPDC096033 TaxID=3366071 RepID=UPI0038014064
MPLGDSITQGVGSSTGADYRGPLQELLGDDVDFVGSQQADPIRDPDHEGHSGYLIQQLRDGLDGWLAAAQPTVVLLHAGINDLDRGETTRAPERLLDLVGQVHVGRPEVAVIVLGLIPTTAGLEGQAQQFNAAVRQGAGAHRFRWVEAPALTAAEIADRLHPNNLGYERIAKAIVSALDQSDESFLHGRSPGCRSVSGG